MASASLEAVARAVATARAGGRMGQNEAQIRDRGGQETLKQWNPTSSRSNSRPPFGPTPRGGKSGSIRKQQSSTNSEQCGVIDAEQKKRRMT